jgi:nitrite reductase/ring-hydroxylating ferredoxin subunit
MPRLIKVATLGELSPGQGKLVQVEGEQIALFNVKGTFHALGAVCPHEGGPLHEGEVEGDSIVCPWHAFDFKVTTGESSVDPDMRVPIYVVEIRGTDVCIEMA